MAPTRTPQKKPPAGDPGPGDREFRREKPIGDPPSRDKPVREPGKPKPERKAGGKDSPPLDEPPPRDGGGPAPEMPPPPKGDAAKGRKRRDPESREERPHAPSVAPPGNKAVSAVPPDPESPFC